MPLVKGLVKGIGFVAAEFAENILNKVGLRERPQADSSGRLDGQTVVITGGNRGQGYEVAMELARRGARVVMGCRDTKLAERTVDHIHALENGSSAAVHKLDLSSMWSVRQFAEVVNSNEERIDVLICNAGTLSFSFTKTADDLEYMFAVNYVGHFLLTMLFLNKLKEAPLAKIIFVASGGHVYVEELHFEDLNLTEEFGVVKAYSHSKLATITMGMELSRRLPDHVHVYMVDPGVCNTDIFKGLPNVLGWFPVNKAYRAGLDLVGKLLMRSPKEGAQSTVHCAVSDEMSKESGIYVLDTAKKYPEAFAMDPKMGTTLFSATCDMVGLEELKTK